MIRWTEISEAIKLFIFLEIGRKLPFKRLQVGEKAKAFLQQKSVYKQSIIPIGSSLRKMC